MYFTSKGMAGSYTYEYGTIVFSLEQITISFLDLNVVLSRKYRSIQIVDRNEFEDNFYSSLDSLTHVRVIYAKSTIDVDLIEEAGIMKYQVTMWRDTGEVKSMNVAFTTDIVSVIS